MALKPLEYRDGELLLRGALAREGNPVSARPGILVVHAARGLDPESRRRAEMISRLGYVALAVDLYGDGFLAESMEEARQWMDPLRNDPNKLRARIRAGLEALAARPEVDRNRIAAIGYCLGGTTVLELARSGADVAGVVSFHGGLKTGKPAEPGEVKAKILVLTGAEDPVIPPAEVAAFEDEMRRAGTDWQVTTYGGARHGFTHPHGANYQEAADRRSWEAMRLFFSEIFKEPAIPALAGRGH